MVHRLADRSAPFFGYPHDEIRSVVEEAEAPGTHVLAHLYTDDAIRRAVEAGMQSVERGNLFTSDTARLVKEEGSFAEPSLMTFGALSEACAALGLPPDSGAKVEPSAAPAFARARSSVRRSF